MSVSVPFLMWFRHATTCCCAKIYLWTTSTWSTSFLGGFCKSTTVPKLQYPFSRFQWRIWFQCPQQRDVCHYTPYHSRWTGITDVPVSDANLQVSDGSFTDSSHLKPKYSSFVWCHNVVMWQILTDQFYQIGQCRNLRIKLRVVDDRDLDRHWLMIVDGQIALKRLHEDQQELQVRLSSQFRNDLHLWFQPMVYFVILIIPVVPWLKPMWCNKFQQCLRWRPWLAVQAKFIQPLNINIMLVLAYNCGRCLLLWCSVVHYSLQICPKTDWFTLYDMIQTYTTVSRYQSDSECLWITSDQRTTTVLGCESCTLLSPSDYLTPEESKRHCQDLLDFLTQDISRGHDMLFNQHDIHNSCCHPSHGWNELHTSWKLLFDWSHWFILWWSQQQAFSYCCKTPTGDFRTTTPTTDCSAEHLWP